MFDALLQNAYLGLLGIGVALGFALALVYFRNPSAQRRSPFPIIFGSVAVAAIGLSALLYEFITIRPTAAFECSFASPIAPSTLNCTDLSTQSTWGAFDVFYGDERLRPIAQTGSSSNNVGVSFEAARPGTYLVKLTAIRQRFGLEQTSTAQRPYSLEAPPPPQREIRTFSFSASGLEGTRTQAFQVAPGQRIVSALLQINAAKNGNVRIVSQSDSQVVVEIAFTGGLKHAPFGFESSPGFVEGQVIAQVEVSPHGR